RSAPVAGHHGGRAIGIDHDRYEHLATCGPRRREAHSASDSRSSRSRAPRKGRGRAELQLALLAEMMRREGFELTVGQPHVLIREIDGHRNEPFERLSIDVPEDYVGVVTQMLALRKGRMEHMTNHGTGWVRMEYIVPARGLIGFRTEFLTETRGTGLMHHVFDRWERWAGELLTRTSGVLVADRSGQTVSFSLMTLQERGALFVGPG